METIKFNISKIKSDIKILVELQKFYKNQRKTETLVGDRQMHAGEAAWKHRVNREKLRLMYAAYGQARGKSYSQIESQYPEDQHPLKAFQSGIENILCEYLQEVEVA